MSTQRGNLKKKAPKHKNVRAFKNDLYDTSHTIKKINELEFHGICNRCKSIIDWKVKYKKYKTLTTKKKCVKCLEKKITDAYYIVCRDCCVAHNICSKCSKPAEDLEFGETLNEKRKKEDQFQQELKQLSERQRRKFLRLLEKGAFTKENLINDPNSFNKDNDSIIGSDSSDDESLDDVAHDFGKQIKSKPKSESNLNKNNDENITDEEENTEECSYDQDDDDDYETQEEVTDEGEE